MRKFRCLQPDINMNPLEIVRTEKEILDEYYETWKKLMKKVGRQEMISKDNCINDWVTTHWAEEIK